MGIADPEAALAKLREFVGLMWPMLATEKPTILDPLSQSCTRCSL